MDQYFMYQTLQKKLLITYQRVAQRKILRLYPVTIILLSSIILASCSGDKDSGSGKTTDDIFTTGTLVRIEEALKYKDDDMVALLDKVRGSIGKFRSGSKVIWSRKNDAGLGLYVSANHVYGVDSWLNYDEDYIDLTIESNGIFLSSHLPNADGNLDLMEQYIADFSLYHPYIPSNTTNINILPANDFYLGVVDNQRLNVDYNGLVSYPGFIQAASPLDMYDPQNRTVSEKTWDEAVVGEQIIVVGYPQDTVNYPYGAVSIGNVFTDLQANEIIDLLSQNGDEEGGIPYNADVEFLVNAKAIAGMSGGGVFNAKGQLLGILVRSTVINKQSVARVVRLKYIKATFESFFNSLFEDEQEYLRRYIGSELDQ